MQNYDNVLCSCKLVVSFITISSFLVIMLMSCPLREGIQFVMTRRRRLIVDE